MESLADVWFRSGKSSECLCPGSKEEIITELKYWVQRRKTFNNIRMAECWDALRTADHHQQIKTQIEANNEMPTQALWDQDNNFAATETRNRIRHRRLKKEKNRENLLSDFLLASLRHQGVRWPQMLRSEARPVDASVCACLGTVDRGFDAETELKTLEDEARILRWLIECRRRGEYTGARDIANDPVSGVNSHPTAIYTADPLGDTDVAAGETNPGTENHVVYVVDTLGNVTTATKPSSSVAADTPQIQDNAGALLSQPSNYTPNAAGPSSSSVTKIGVKTQNPPETEGPDKVDKISKNKKKRESKKRAKARAKEAATNPEDADTPKIQDNAAASLSKPSNDTPNAAGPSSASLSKPSNDTLNAAGPSSASLSTPSNDTPNAAGPSSSTVTKIAVKTQNTPETEGQDEVGKMSKSQKKRENRKQAKARANDAAANAEDTVGNNDNDDKDGDVPSLVAQ